MKSIAVALLFSLPVALVATEVRIGDTFDEVHAALGASRGQMRVGGRLLLYYERGEVELKAGTVTRVALVSVEEHSALEAKRAAAAVRLREEQELRRASLIAEGEALKTRKLADSVFLATPLSYQVAFWENFARRYSDVPSDEPLALVRMRLAEQNAELRARAMQAERLAALEVRVIEAEARAVEAETRVPRVRYRYISSPDGSFAHQPFTLWPIEYRYYDSPLPYATSPGMPPIVPTYRNDQRSPSGGWRDQPLDSNDRPFRSHERDFNRGPRQSERGAGIDL